MFNVLLDAATTEQGIGGMLPLLAVYAIFFVILYFVLIRPQRKRQKETTNMQNAIVNGDWVLLNNGMYGKVVNVVNDNLMVEFGTNRSIIIPVRRDQVLAKEEPDLTQKTYEGRIWRKTSWIPMISISWRRGIRKRRAPSVRRRIKRQRGKFSALF